MAVINHRSVDHVIEATGLNTHGGEPGRETQPPIHCLDGLTKSLRSLFGCTHPSQPHGCRHSFKPTLPHHRIGLRVEVINPAIK